MAKKLKCKKHPTYKAHRPPKTCETCWAIYAAKHPANYTAIMFCGAGK